MVAAGWQWQQGVGGEVEDHSKASGLELRQPRGAQAVGLVWRGESGDINQRASNEGHSRQAVVLSNETFFVFFLLY